MSGGILLLLLLVILLLLIGGCGGREGRKGQGSSCVAVVQSRVNLVAATTAHCSKSRRCLRPTLGLRDGRMSTGSKEGRRACGRVGCGHHLVLLQWRVVVAAFPHSGPPPPHVGCHALSPLLTAPASICTWTCSSPLAAAATASLGG